MVVGRVAVRHVFDQHTLDGAAVRAALLDLVVQLGLLLRRREQVARAVTLTLRFAGGTSWAKTRRMPESSAHDDDLRTVAYQLMDAAGLQRGRLTSLVLRGEDLVSAPTGSPGRSAWAVPARPVWSPRPRWTASAPGTGPPPSSPAPPDR
ncbi:hypothetical protein [Streptomyces sp. NPDC002619]|uniref:DinB/UmuC family translesion DNA polymerase n=1 Tax=Streptomyces sp. NPDC002619 TaxID=3364655 RepID=UPI0036CAE263